MMKSSAGKHDFDVVMPQGNEEMFIDAALAMGYDEIVFLCTDLKYRYKSDRIKIRRGFLVKTINQIAIARKSFELVFAPAERQFFESRVDYIVNAELFDRADSFHFKRTSLNQVHAKLCKEKGSAIVFSFGNLFLQRRTRTLGRMFQNAKIVKKYAVQHHAFSMADDPMRMKSRCTLDALLRVLGTA